MLMHCCFEYIETSVVYYPDNSKWHWQDINYPHHSDSLTHSFIHPFISAK